METMVERQPVGKVCPLCGCSGEPVGIVEGVCVRECCGVLLSWAWKSEKAYQAFYADISQFHEGQQESEGHPTTIARDAEHLRASRSRVKTLFGLYGLPWGTRVLDVGAGGGSFVQACGENGLDALGLEPCAALALWARGQGRKVECGRLQDFGGEYDVITMHDVLEHLTEPEPSLCFLNLHLSHGGILVVEMPEWNCPQSKREHLRWRHVLPKQHVALYSDRAAQELFARCGLRVESLVRPLRGSIGKIAYYLSRAE